MKPGTLTPKQKQVFDFICAFQKEHGAPPSLREMARHLGLKSLHTVQQHLRLICQKGYLRLHPGKARGITICVDADLRKNIPFSVPLIGSVAAGLPILADENIIDYLALDPSLFKEPDLFTLRVKGDSMQGIGVLDGDYVVVRRQSQAHPGDVVVAIIEEEATLKRFIIEEDKIILRAENPAYADIVIPPGQPTWIAGKMIGLIRKC
ncbi:MAG: transcriptional repressor LexA [Desulfobacteraceae bacterium]|nr:MAG: transcriptional repressor LexA [Desulfobacteraceae bacterium]